MAEKVVLDAGSLILRPWVATDIDTLVQNASDRRVAINLRDRFPYPYTRRDAEAWIALCTQAEQAGQSLMNFAIEVDGSPVGGIGLEPMGDVHNRTAELGFWLGHAYWGRGLATAAVIAITAYAFETLGLERLQAAVFDWNPASARVLEKAGFTLEGRLRRHVTKDGRVGDELVFGRLRSGSPPAST